MPSIQVADQTSQEKSLFLVSGHLPYVTDDFIESLLPDFKLIILHNTHHYSTNKDVYQVQTTATETITKLKEIIEYAVFFITSPRDKAIVEEMLPKLERDNPRTLILFSVANYAEYADILLRCKAISNICFGIIGEMFGSDVPANYSSVSTIVHAARTNKTVSFIGNELISVYPISNKDILTGITYLLFSTHKQTRVFYFFYEHPQTLISTIHILKRIEPDLQINHDDSQKPSPLLTHAELNKKLQSHPVLPPTYLEDVFLGFEKSVKETQYPSIKTTEKQLSNKKNRKQKKVQRKRKRSFIPLVIYAVLLFFIVNVILTLGGVFFAKRAISQLNTGDFTNAKRSLTYASTSFDLSKPVVELGFSLIQLLPVPSLKETYETFLSGVAITEIVAQQLDKIEGTQTGMAHDDFINALSILTYLYFTAQSSPEYQRLPHINFLTKSSTSNVLSTLSVLPTVMGYEGEKKYLLLFQNNGELRPTGGFIGSVGELLLENGRVEDLTIQDVYDIDGQIKTHTEPPYIVRRFLQPHLYLRDSNFALDFQEAATTAAALYKEGKGSTVDGVIAVDYTVLQKILEITGPIYLPTYDKTIDAKTGFDFIQSTIEDTFIPGASQKKSVLSEVFTQLLLKVEQPNTLLQIAKNLPELIEEKHVLFALKDPSVQDIFTAQQYAGSLRTQNQSNTDTLSTYLAINEANIGVNKANMIVTRSVSLLQKIQTDTVISSATLTLDNTRGTENYKAYIRYVLPQDVSFSDLLINGSVVTTTPAITNPRLYEAPSFKPPSDRELTEEKYNDKNVYGFIHTVPPGKKEFVTLQYSQPHQLSDQKFTYELLYQPQPGIAPTPFTLSLEFPEGLTARDTATTTVAQKKYSSSYVIKKDTTMTIDFYSQ